VALAERLAGLHEEAFAFEVLLAKLEQMKGFSGSIVATGHCCFLEGTVQKNCLTFD